MQASDHLPAAPCKRSMEDREWPRLACEIALAISAFSMGGAVDAQTTPASHAPYFDETRAMTLFAFDDVSIAFTQNLKLVMRSPTRHAANPIVRRGPPGSCDAWAVQFYGSVIRTRDKFRMWYVAAGEDRLDRSAPRSSPWRVAYAESQDGVHWTKPNLGLVEYNGNRNNNLVRLEPRLGTLNVKVLHDPDDPDTDRR